MPLILKWISLPEPVDEQGLFFFGGFFSLFLCKRKYGDKDN